MAHAQQIIFCNSVKSKQPAYFQNKIVVDIGSLDINGNNQYLFEDCLYLGVDLASGRNVDIVTAGHNLTLPDSSIDVIISAECFEHDIHYSLTLENIIRLLKPGGLFLFTCATTGRPEHGTRRTTPHDAPFLQNMEDWGDYYKNLTEQDIREVIDVESVFEEYAFDVGSETNDLYFWGVKKGTLISRYDYSFQIQASAARLELKAKSEHISKLENSIAFHSDALKERDAQINARDNSINARDTLINARDLTISSRDLQIEQLTHIINTKNHEYLSLNRQLNDCNFTLNKIISSNSWQITRPLRWINSVLKRFL